MPVARLKSRLALDSQSRCLSQRITTIVAALVVAATIGIGAAPAGAITPSPAWSIRTFAEPTDFAPGDSSGADVYKVVATNAGSLPTDGSSITIADTLPGDVTAVRVAGIEYESHILSEEGEPEWHCTTTPVECIYTGVVPAGDVLEMDVTVATEPSAAGSLRNAATVTGGGAAGASTSAQNPVSPNAAPFEITDFGFAARGVDGAPDTQASSHPYAVTTTLDFSTQPLPKEPELHEPAENIKDAVVELPLGLVGNPQAAPRCPLSELELEAQGSTVQCPADTKIGAVTLNEPIGFASSLFPQISGQLITSVSSLYNLVPEHGHPAEFGFDYAGLAVALLYPSVVHTKAGYMLRVTTPSTPSEFAFFEEEGFVSGFSLTLSGDPAKQGGTGEAPFFTNPSACTGSGLDATIHVDTWGHPGRENTDGTPDFTDPNWLEAKSALPPVVGCDALSFDPTLTLQPDRTQADSPTGIAVDLRVPQAPSSDAALAAPDLKRAVVTLPTGMSVSPSAANGLEACSPAQIGLESNGEANNSQPACPEASKVGTVEIDTPLLAEPLEGSVYLATQNENPFGSLIALYVVVDDPTTGIVLKIPGEVSLNALTGQITTNFDETPQLPFSELKLHLKGGPEAPLATPQGCGTYTTTSSLTPWSAPASGPAATPSGSFEITSGCSMGFAPSFVAGTVNNQAGAFSPFTLTLSRSDADQDLGELTVQTPPGLLGMLSRVQLCQEPQAGEGTCPAASQIGHVTVGAGPGPDPVYVPQPGKPQDPVYLTGPYKGAPFGLSVVVPAEAGPFNLDEGGRPVVVRSAISVDPHTSQITISSDPFPSILQGVPLQIKTVNVTIDREGFMFNPTDCNASSVNGTVVSTQGAHDAVSTPFEAANCASLAFSPGFAASTAGKASKANGASLDVKVTANGGPQSGGREANIRSVKVDLPRQLPSRLTTLQKACLAVTFEANPADCPKESDVGTATAVTPALAQPLSGPAYLVSHGGEAFPDMEIVLQGEGIVLILDGNTDIKKGITSSTFRAVPDAPISSFELRLPTGKFSILGTALPESARYNLCGQTLAMPTLITGQNGAIDKRTTKIAVTGCSKPKPKKAHRAGGKHSAHKGTAGRRRP